SGTKSERPQSSGGLERTAKRLSAARRLRAPSAAPSRPAIEGYPEQRNAPVGSNGWAVSGQLTSTGAALVSSDMHLGLRVPTIWYRARLKLSPQAGGGGDTALDATGVTLPG